MNLEDNETGQRMKLQNIVNAEVTSIVDVNVIFAYGATADSSQGARVEGRITIHQHNLSIVSRGWLRCAATSLDMSLF